MTRAEQDMAEMIAAHHPPVTCEGCGAELPDDQAADIFPMCWRCLEETLQSETHA